MQNFIKPPKLRELGAASGHSYWSIRRLVNAGVAPCVTFPDGDRIATEWANRYVQHGLTADEIQQYREYTKEKREAVAR